MLQLCTRRLDRPYFQVLWCSKIHYCQHRYHRKISSLGSFHLHSADRLTFHVGNLIWRDKGSFVKIFRLNLSARKLILSLQTWDSQKTRLFRLSQRQTLEKFLRTKKTCTLCNSAGTKMGKTLLCPEFRRHFCRQLEIVAFQARALLYYWSFGDLAAWRTPPQWHFRSYQCRRKWSR